MATFDVVIPCYNYGRYLPRCVASVLDQEGVDVRVLIIDDCSTDDSAKIGQRLADQDPRIQFRRHEKNQGHIATYNEGLLGWATGDYSLLLSADDAVAPGAFKRALNLFEASDDVGFVFGPAKIIKHDEEFRFSETNDFESSQIVSGQDFLKFCCENTLNPVPTSTAIVRTALQKRLGGYSSKLPHSGDMEMWMRFALNGRIGLVRSVQGEYRQHDRNMSQDAYARIAGDRSEFALTCRVALDPILSSSPEARQWLNTMHQIIFSYAEQNALAAFEGKDARVAKAWLNLEEEMASHLPAPTRSPRLRQRKIIGYRVWRLLRAVKTALGLPAQKYESLDVIWAPKHGDLIGWWPDPVTGKSLPL